MNGISEIEGIHVHWKKPIGIFGMLRPLHTAHMVQSNCKVTRESFGELFFHKGIFPSSTSSSFLPPNPVGEEALSSESHG